MAAELEEEAIRYYFSRSYDYATILRFLEKDHDIKISKRTLLNRLKQYGLRRRGRDVDDDIVREHIRRELDGSGSLLGYRSMWRRLHSKYGINVPRSTVQALLRDLDPEGTKLRKAHRLKRREYLNPGPNYCWHSDGYDKIKPYGFPIHGCIDGFSRRLIWLKVTKSNNDPRIIGTFFMESIQEFQGCPTLLRTDRGTENGIMATVQCFLRRNHQDSLAGVSAHRYGSSHSNQRIEGWWAFLRRSWSSWWMNFFKDMVDKGELDTSNPLQMECLWFCFNKVIQNELNQVKENWNSHYIRESRHQTAAGIPDKLYFLPETVGAVDHKHRFNISDLQEAGNEISSCDVDPDITNESSDYCCYFEYTLDNLGINEPNNWRECLTTYLRLVTVAG
jgi:hypothetical protein